MSKGYCTTIISGRGFYVDDENKLGEDTWFDARTKMVLVPIDTWAALKKYLIINCKKSKRCSSNIDSWTRSMLEIDSLVEGKSSAASILDKNSSK